MNALITTHNLHRHYQRGPQTIRAVNGVDLSIDRGCFVAIVGSSGSGKSTLLNLLAGLDTPTEGEIVVDGESLTSMPRRERSAYRARRVGMVFQSFNLLPYKTAQENVEMALYFNGVARGERSERACAMLASVGLEDRLDHRPADLSGGEQQRVAVARALVKRPDIIFADEPTGNLDLDNAVQMADLLVSLRNEGLTVVVVTHNVELARQYANRTIRMQYGAVVEDNGEFQTE